MDLREPRRKRVSPNMTAQQPFPVMIESESGISVSSDLWTIYTGTYNGHNVSLTDREEMTALYNMGFFGKGSLSRRGCPDISIPKKGIPHMIKEQQWERRKKWMQEMSSDGSSTSSHNTEGAKQKADSESEAQTQENQSNEIDNKCVTVDKTGNSTDETSANDGTSLNKSDTSVGNTGIQENNHCVLNDTSRGKVSPSDQVVVLPDSDDEADPKDGAVQYRIENEPIKTVIESLNLTLEEAFFLSFGLGCLQVFNCFGQFLSLENMWKLYRESQHDFIENYITYHYFRAKGWVVKHGYKYGGDFLLYKQGPPFNHASYLVLVEAVNADGSRKDVTKKSASWINLMSIARVAETAGKDVLLCQVIWPASLTNAELKSPNVIRKFQVNEILMRRWVSSQERDEKES